MKYLSLQAGYTKAILSLSFGLLSLAKWVETIYEVAALLRNDGIWLIRRTWLTNLNQEFPDSFLFFCACSESEVQITY